MLPHAPARNHSCAAVQPWRSASLHQRPRHGRLPVPDGSHNTGDMRAMTVFIFLAAAGIIPIAGNIGLQVRMIGINTGIGNNNQAVLPVQPRA